MSHRLLVPSVSAVVLAALAGSASAAVLATQQGKLFRAVPVEVEGARTQWQFMTLTFATSVDTDELLHAPGRNPFLDHRLVVRFSHAASGTEYAVNGFYAGDGNAADTSATGGNRWRVRFTPDHAGRWDWQAEFRRGPAIAVDRDAPGAPADPRVDGAFGFFHVASADQGAPGFLGKGRLDYVGEHYCRFAETGEPFLKSGAGGPENFLAYFEFDGTFGDPGNPCLPGPQFLHTYAPHAADFVADDVGLAHLWAGGKGQNVLGAIDYLASVGVNSIYFITNTWKGDGWDVWPWTTPADKLHFDVSRLEQWERLFSYMSHRGIQLQFVFEETENDQLSVPQGGVGDGLTLERKLYYREMIARFSHHHAVHWVTGDESDYFDEPVVMEQLVGEMRALDPWKHPVAFHCQHPCPTCTPIPFPTVFQQYQPYFGSDVLDSTVYQTAPGGYNSSVRQLVSGQVGLRKWVHYGDEQSLNATPSNLVTNRTRTLWGNLMGGGAGIAWYPGNGVVSQYGPGEPLCDYYDLTVEDFRVLEDYFLQTDVAVSFFRDLLPFTEMTAGNFLASSVGPSDYVFHRPEDPGLGVKAVYAVYRGTGSATALTIGAGTHQVEWYNPRTGAGPLSPATIEGPGAVALPLPAQDPGMDWFAVVTQL